MRNITRLPLLIVAFLLLTCLGLSQLAPRASTASTTVQKVKSVGKAASTLAAPAAQSVA
jgi:hypothetical protein